MAQIQRDLQSRGVSGPELKKQLDQASGMAEKRALLRRPFLDANDRSRWCRFGH